MKGHKFSYDRTGANSTFVYGRCECGWSMDMPVTKVASARQAHKRHVEREAAKDLARDLLASS